MGSKVLVSLLISGVFRDEVEVFSADDEGTVHLGGNDSSGQDTTTDGDETGEWALLVDVASLNGGLWGSESQSNVLVPSAATLSNPAGLGLRLRVKEDVRLLLESALRLYGKFGGHGCEIWSIGRKFVVVVDRTTSIPKTSIE